MAIKAVPTYKYNPTLSRLTTVPAPKPVAVRKPAVPQFNLTPTARSLQQMPGFAGPVTPFYVGPAPVTTQTTPASTGPTKAVPLSAVPGNYEASLADIMGHPLSEAALGAYNTQQQSLMRALQSTAGQAVIKSGYDPSAAFKQLLASRPDLGDFASIIDPAAIAAANANPLSERALTEQQYNTGMSNLDYQLAGAGILGSGAQVTGGNQILQNRQLSENASRAALMDAIQGGISSNLSSRATGYQRLQDVYGQVAQLLAQRQGAVPETGTADVEDVANVPESPIPGTNIPSAATPPASYVNWGGQQMRSVNQMKQWLAQHGGNWNTWAAQHPAAARQLAGLGG
jgi:hypothetical protein